MLYVLGSPGTGEAAMLSTTRWGECDSSHAAPSSLSPALRLAQAQVGPETGGHLNAAPRTNDSTRIARNR